MADDSGNKPRATGNLQSAPSVAAVRAFTERAPRCRVVVAVLCLPRGEGAPDEQRSVDAELVNLSASGMLVTGTATLDVGTIAEFQFQLGDGLTVLSGSAEVVRHDGAGMAMKFVTLGAGGEELVARLVEAGISGSEVPPAPRGDEPAVAYGHGAIRVRLSAATARYFTFNPLLHIGVGGCFLPAEKEVALGTGYQLDVVDGEGRLVLRCKTKVAARQERWIGLRFVDVGRDEVHALRAALAKLPG